MSYAVNIDNKYDTYYLKPGFIYVSKNPTIVTTILGSCLSVCLYDTHLNYSGINHYLFPIYHEDNHRNAKYGDVSTQKLLHLMKEYGSSFMNIRATLVGGAFLFDLPTSRLVSESNLNIAKAILEKFNIKISRKITGGNQGRKIQYYTDTGEINVSNIKKTNIPELNYFKEELL